MTLLQAGKGRRVRILEIPDDRARAQCVRFGIGEGTVVDSTETLMAGPVLLRHCNQEICVGRKLASSILVEVDAEGAKTRSSGKSPAGAAVRSTRRHWGLRGR
ncbi:MAG: FeoA family protein [Thermoleophilia bacterium]